jgi:hypothetical protein
MAINLDHEDLIDNIHDASWRIQNCYLIRNKKGKTSKLNLNKTQNVLHAARSRFNMTLKGRQQGVSTYYLLKYLDLALWNENINVGILSHDQDSIEKLFRIPSFAYKSMPEEIKPRIDKGGGSKYEMFFPDINSRIYVDLEIRSESLSALHVSEYGLMKDKNRFLGSVEAVDVNAGQVSIESTPFGINHFYSDWIDSEFPYEKHFFPWFFHHENQIEGVNELNFNTEELKLIEMAAKNYDIILTAGQIAWRRFKIKSSGSKNKFLQEHPEDDLTCFLISGNPVLDKLDIKSLEVNCRKGNIVKKIEVYLKAETGHRYIIGCDVAEGVGGDDSALTVIDLDTMQQVASYAGQINPFDYADLIKDCSDLYTTEGISPLVVVERNNHGHAVLLKLERFTEGLSLYYYKDKRVGLPTDKITRPLALDTFIDSINNESVLYRDKILLEQCLHLVDNKGKIEASSGQKDDRVLANALALYVATQARSIKLPRIEIL